MRSVTSISGSLRCIAALGLSLGLAACGSSQNWHDDNPYASVGGTVSGLSGGTLELWNNGKDKLTVAADGSFTFPLQIASGSSYTVVVATQPAGQTCTVASGTGTATGNVKTVAVTCRAYTFQLRPLPAVYATAKAVNYSPYRTARGPIDQEVPSDAQILQDLGLLHTAGYSLLRLFGASPPATDVVAEKILDLAARNYPDMKFQLGISLHGVTSCSDTVNDANIAYVVSKLSKYPNVVTISVGNETSFYSKYMPVACLEGYIKTIRAQVTQPVTADDDFTFYAGKTSAGGDRVAVKPDTILKLIDFVSVHLYPISNPNWWNWQQSPTPAAGPARAKAMMEASLAAAKNWYGEVAAYQYANNAGITVRVGDTLPIVIGETGWKSVQTNSASEIEQYAALPANAKWYADLLYGNAAQGYPAWEGAQGGPARIFWFEAFDEAWKGSDDGWGLWDAARNARYALCGTPAGPACKADLYQGAGYYDPPVFATVTFDDPAVTYTLSGFGGAEDSQVVADPAGGTNKVARVLKSATAELWAGTTASTHGGNTVGTIPFTASSKQMTVRVFAPAAGITVRLKVEDAANSAHSVETDAVTTKAGAWETLTFNFANPAAGTPSLDLSYTYNRLSIFFNFGKTGAAGGAGTYYFDDVTFVAAGGGGFSGVWSSKYSQVDASNWLSAEGGAAGTYIDTGVATQYWWNGNAPSDSPPSFYFGYGISSAAKPWGFGAFVKAPGNGTVSATGFTSVRIAVWGNDELMNTHPALTLVLKGPAIGGCAAEAKGTINVTATGPQTYNVPFASLTLQTPCAFSTVADALAAGVSEIHVQVLGANVQYATTTDPGGFYPNGLNVGPISFN